MGSVLDPPFWPSGAQPGRPRVGTHFQRRGPVSVKDACMAKPAAHIKIMHNSGTQLGQVQLQCVAAAAATVLF